MKKSLLLIKSLPWLFCATLCLSFCDALYGQDEVLYTRQTPESGSVPSYQDLEFGGEAYFQSADDFEVPAGQTWNITRIIAPGTTVPETSIAYDYYGDVLIFADDQGQPGDQIYRSNFILSSSGAGNPDLEIILPETLTLGSGIYWISVLGSIADILPIERWSWKTTTMVTRNTANYRDTHFLEYTLGIWVPVHEAFPSSPVDLLFTLYGTASGQASPSSPFQLAVAHVEPSFHLSWTDMSDDETGFVIERGTDGENFEFIATVAMNDTSYTDTDSFDRTLRYFYRVGAVNDTGVPAYSYPAFDDIVDTLYVQVPSGELQISHSQLYNPEDNSVLVISADDFAVPGDEIWNFKEIRVLGSNAIPAAIKNGYVIIFSDSSGYPTKHEIYFSGPLSISREENMNPDLTLSLPEILTLTEGRYWIGVYAEHYLEGYWYWSGKNMISGTQAHSWEKRSYSGLSGDWTPVHIANDSDGPFDLIFTLLGVKTGSPSDSIPPPAPVAKPASFVSNNSFTANWSPVAEADYYELDVVNLKDSSFLEGYDGMIVYGTSHTVLPAKNKRYGYVVRAVNEYGESGKSNLIQVARIKNLTLRSVCSNDPAVYRRWRVINNNPFAVETTWTLPDSTQAGSHEATPGESFFTTETVPGIINYVILSWHDDKMISQSSKKSATWKPCDSLSNPTVHQSSYADLSEYAIPFKAEVYPNPISEKVKLFVSSPLDGMVKIEIVNAYGQRFYSGDVTTNTLHEIDAANLPAGMLFMKASQKRHKHVTKIMKQ